MIFDVPVNGGLVDLPALKQTSNEREEAKFLTEAEIRRRECQNIFLVLQKTGWKIKGAMERPGYWELSQQH
jgi:hypothetical protein